MSDMTRGYRHCALAAVLLTALFVPTAYAHFFPPAQGSGSGDFLAAGTVPMTGTLDLGTNAIVGFTSWVGTVTGTLGAPTTLTAAESGKLLSNEGAAEQLGVTLPTAAAGLRFVAVVQDADGLRINANTGDTIRLSTSVSSSAGYVESTTVGSTVTLVAINATEWVAVEITGTWSLN